MSKSKGNVFTIPELVAKGHRPEAIRYLLLSGALPQTINFTWEASRQAAAALQRVHGLLQRLGEVEPGGPSAPGSRRPASRPRGVRARRSPTTSTRRRRWPPSTCWSARATRCWRRAYVSARGRRGARRSRAHGRRAGRAAAPEGRAALARRSRRSSTSARRRAGARVPAADEAARARWRSWGSSWRTRRRARAGGGSAERLLRPRRPAARAGAAKSWPAGTWRPGFAIVARNFRCRSGEAGRGGARTASTTVFVEVKERHGRSHGEGHEAVTFGKRRRIVRAARLYAAARGLDGDAPALRRGVDRLGGRPAAHPPRARRLRRQRGLTAAQR